MAVLATVLAVTFGNAALTHAWEPGGAATVSVTVDFVAADDLATPVAELRANPNAPQSQWRVGLQVGYSCDLAAPCEAATVAIAPQPVDAFYGTQRFARYDSASLPEGATISGDEATGYTVALGTLAAGTSGAFTLLYEWQGRRFDTPAPQSFFLDGTIITSTATIDATNAGALATASDSVTFRIDTPNPEVAIVPPELARANTDYTYTVRMAAGCMRSDTVIFGEPANLCAASYTNTLTLPPGATFVGASPDGAYDSVAHTVTWAVSGQAAATGWGTIDGTGHDRAVTVRFPDTMFTPAARST